MNKNFLPIIGEYKNSKFILNIISLVEDKTIVIKIGKNYETIFELEQYKCQKIILPVQHSIINIKIIADKEKYEFNVNISDNRKINIFNCDNHYLEQTDLWERAKPAIFNFHIGDQIYLDELFMKHANDLQNKKQIFLRRDVYTEYIKAFSRKAHILQSGFNIMLGDDHEIVDESLYSKFNKNIVKYLSGEYKRIFIEIQASLRFENEIVQVGNMDFLLIDNINTLSYQNYKNNLMQKVLKYKSNNEFLYILSPRVPLNFKSSFLNKAIFEVDGDYTNYIDFYNLLFDLPQKVKILCGDAHIYKSFKITKNEKNIDLILVGTMNSPIDQIEIDENLFHTDDIKCKEIEKIPKNSFVYINDNIITTEFSEPRNFQKLNYLIRYFKARYEIRKCCCFC